MGKGYLAALALVGVLFAAITLSAPMALVATCDDAAISISKPGCCSHHQGVCGCNYATGMQRCCDGTDSKSCKCGE